MAIKLNVKIPDLSKLEAAIDVSVVKEEFLTRLGELARDEWNRIASRELGSTQMDYRQGIYGPVRDGDSVTVALTGWLPQAIEQGLPAFDMKPGFMRAAKEKGKDYFTVPFKWSGPGASGHTGPNVPKDIYATLMRRGSVSRRAAGIQGMRSKINKPAPNYTWKTSPYAGMKKTGSSRQTQIFTFRRVSEKSPPGSWRHPGIKPRNFIKRVVDFVTSQSGPLFKRIVSEIRGSS